MANDSYKARSTGPKGLSKKGKKIERSHYPVLLQAQKAWEEIDPFRHKRKRNRNYTYGKQWNDLIKLPDGRVMSEEEYVGRYYVRRLGSWLSFERARNVHEMFEDWLKSPYEEQ